MKYLLVVLPLIIAMWGCSPSPPSSYKPKAQSDEGVDTLSTPIQSSIQGENYVLEIDKKILFDPIQRFELYTIDGVTSSDMVHTLKFKDQVELQIYNRKTNLVTSSKFVLTIPWREYLLKDGTECTTILSYLDVDKMKDVKLSVTIKDSKVLKCVLGNITLKKK